MVAHDIAPALGVDNRVEHVAQRVDALVGQIVEVVDLEQIVLRGRLVLGVLVTAPRDVRKLRARLEASAVLPSPGSADVTRMTLAARSVGSMSIAVYSARMLAV